MLVILGITGVIGFLGSVSHSNLFNPPKWIHWIHLGSGFVVLAAAVSRYRRLQIGLALLGAVAGTALGIGGLALELFTHVRDSAQAVDLSDPRAHLAVCVLAIWPLYTPAARPSR